MPNKPFLFFLIFSLTLCSAFCLEASEKDLLVADTLFQKGNYTEALAIYSDFFEQRQQASTQMLLKMAFIHEGLEQYAEALYYLSLYYRQRPSFEGLAHMEALAQRASLSGYEYSEFDFFRAFYHRYFEEISLGLLGIGLCCFLVLSYTVVRRWQVAQYYFIILLIFLILAFSVIVFTKQPPKGVISKNQTYLMDAPSAASKVSQIINKGHKVKILGQQDVWYKLAWGERTVYVHQNNLKFIF